MALLYLLTVPIAALALWQSGRTPHLAMVTVPIRRATSNAAPNGFQLLAMMSQRERQSADPFDYDPLTKPRPWWNKLGVGSRPPRPPVVGRKAWIQWWERLRSLVLLTAVVASLGVLLAAAVGVFVFLLGFLLEQAVS